MLCKKLQPKKSKKDKGEGSIVTTTEIKHKRSPTCFQAIYKNDLTWMPQ